MRIDDRWSIEQGNDCFVVVERRNGRNPKTGEATQTESRTYHPTLGQCVKKIVRTHTLDAVEEEDLWDALMQIQAGTDRLIHKLEEMHQEALGERRESVA